MHCEICGCELGAEEAISCVRCHAPFHRDCWSFNGRCGIYGCGESHCVDYVPPEEGALVSIDESSRPPFRLAPHVESLVRRLPAWGRGAVPPLVLGLVGASVTWLLLSTWVTGVKPEAITLLYGAGVSIAVLANVMGRWLRRSSVFAAILLGFLYTVMGGILEGMSTKFYSLMGVYCVLGALFSSALTEALAGRLRRPGLTGLFLLGIRSAMAGGIFWGSMILQRLVDACPFYPREMWVLPMLSLFVAVLPLEAGKSSLMNRIKAEAHRLRLGPGETGGD